MTWSFFDKDGAISTRTFCGSAKLVALNTPPGLVAIEGSFDPLSQRVDVEALAAVAGVTAADCVIDYQPPQPDEDHEWRENVDNGRPRWVKKADVVERERADAVARARLAEIDLSLVRPLLELYREPSNESAAKRVAALEAEAAELRKSVVRTKAEDALAEEVR